MGSHFFFGDAKPCFADGDHDVAEGVDDLDQFYISDSSVGDLGGDLGVGSCIWVRANSSG
jgi:hypothetical protein